LCLNFFKEALDHTCFFSKNAKGVSNNGEFIEGTEIHTGTHISNHKLPDDLVDKNITISVKYVYISALSPKKLIVLIRY